MHGPRPVDGIKVMSRCFPGSKEEIKSSLLIQEIAVQFLLGCPEGDAQSRNTFYPCKKKKKAKWRTELPEGFACPFSHSPFNGADYWGERTGHGCKALCKVPGKNNANRFLFQKEKFLISYPV